MKKTYIFVVLLSVAHLSVAQKGSLLIGTDFPIQYTVGYNYGYGDFSTQFQFGILTKPYDNVILSIVEGFGADPNIVNIVRNSFKNGKIITLKQQYHQKKMYFGVYLQNINLRANEVPLDIVEDYYNVNLTSYWSGIPIIPGMLNYGNELTKIELLSRLWQIGLLVGRQFELSNPKLELRTEFSISKNMFSSNKFSSQTPYPQTLFNNMETDLKETYKKSAYIPSVNIYLLYHF